ncbi:MAG: YigZ family protein [Butyricicoccus sp.]|nr:YigZ family protein [Butyricicoccus sp.]
MTTYLIPAGFGEAEYAEKRSRFIARVWPVADEAEALGHLADMRRQHYDASHNVYAYIIRENGIMRYSDDGEPSGTSGQPTLSVLRGEELQDVCCVVTRYFGGTLLGTGGLVRAYTAAAKLAVEAAGVSMVSLWKSAGIVCPYARFERVRRLLEEHGAVIESTDFAADVSFRALVREDAAGGFATELTELTAGSVECRFDGECLRAVRIR